MDNLHHIVSFAIEDRACLPHAPATDHPDSVKCERSTDIAAILLAD
jgi:hypothetical protein